MEGRQLLTAAAAGQVAMLGATTLDSKGVTVTYQVEGAPLAAPPTLGVYRSATNTAGAGAVGLADVTAPAVDAAGQPSTSVGVHVVTVPLPGGLPPNPEHAYVVVVADPNSPGATNPGRSADFRVYTIGVIVHGGIQPQSWKNTGPPWEQTMANSLRAEGYDLVIPWNWVAESGHPGAAAKQVPRLARTIDQAVADVPAGSPVDLHLIGHSEGAVVVSQALFHITETPALARGYTELTLLDPHPAGNGIKGQQYSVEGGIVGDVAKGEIRSFQGKANDPLPYIAPNVSDAQVYYQHTPVGLAHTNGGIYNLWGDVPVAAAPGVPVHYANLTGSGISHAGDFGIPTWYQTDVVPLLGDGPAFVDPGALTATETVGLPGTATFSGTATPGASVSVLGVPAGSKTPVPIGRATAGAQGDWEIASPYGASRRPPGILRPCRRPRRPRSPEGLRREHGPGLDAAGGLIGQKASMRSMDASRVARRWALPPFNRLPRPWGNCQGKAWPLSSIRP